MNSRKFEKKILKNIFDEKFDAFDFLKLLDHREKFKAQFSIFLPCSGPLLLGVDSLEKDEPLLPVPRSCSR